MSSNKDKEDFVKALWVSVLLGIVFGIGFAGWYGLIGSDCPSFWLSDRCAFNVLKSSCGQTHEVLGIVNVEDFPDMPPSTVKMRRVTYEFKKIPEPGQVSTAETLRATPIFVYRQKLDGSGKPILDNNHNPEYEWVTSCE